MQATQYFNGDETANRYIRVIALCCVDLFVTIPSLIYFIVDVVVRRSSRMSWAETNPGECTVAVVPVNDIAEQSLMDPPTRFLSYQINSISSLEEKS